MNQNPAPGWYTDPKDPQQKRYWDGSRWTTQTRPVAEEAAPETPAPPPPAPAQPPPAPPPAAAAQPPVPQPTGDRPGGGYPINFEADFARDRDRVTTFFRLILAIPWIVVGAVYVIAAEVVVLIAWFALLILGRYPEWAYNFVSGVLRYTMRFYAWAYLQVDAFPPFGLAPDPSYPVRVDIAPRPEKQSRLKVFFRLILAIPLWFVYYAMAYLHLGAAFVSWMTIVFRGYQPLGVHHALTFTNAWFTRTSAYLFLLCDQYPPVGEGWDRNAPAPQAAPAQ